MKRDVTILVDKASWGSRKIPAGVAALATPPQPRAVSILGALLDLAVLSRPIVVGGFSLSDFWAWLRYIPALAATPELRLRDEWDELDAHQKTLLSDDFGVAFGAHVLWDALNVEAIGETRSVLKLALGSKWSGRKGRRRGPRKAPDFMFLTRSGEIGVIECKGSQSSVDGVIGAMTDGVVQKRSLRYLGSNVIDMSLVTGLFVPHFRDADGPSLRIEDPPLDGGGEEDEGVGLDLLRQCIRRVFAAHALTLSGLSRVAMALGSEGKVVVRDQLQRALRLDREAWADLGEAREIFTLIATPVVLGDGTAATLRLEADQSVDLGLLVNWSAEGGQLLSRPVLDSGSARITFPFGLALQLWMTESRLPPMS